MARNNPTMIVLHCTDVSWQRLRDQLLNVNSYHKAEGFLESSLGLFVGYHHLITGGRDYKCKEDYEEGCHCNQIVNNLSVNIQSIGLCTGFDGDSELPNPVDYDLLQKLVWAYQDKYKISNEQVYFHRHFNTAKTCPGTLCTPLWLGQLLTRPAPPSQKPAEQNTKQIEILTQQVSLLQRLIGLWQQIKHGTS